MSVFWPPQPGFALDANQPVHQPRMAPAPPQNGGVTEHRPADAAAPALLSRNSPLGFFDDHLNMHAQPGGLRPGSPHVFYAAPATPQGVPYAASPYQRQSPVPARPLSPAFALAAHHPPAGRDARGPNSISGHAGAPGAPAARYTFSTYLAPRSPCIGGTSFVLHGAPRQRAADSPGRPQRAESPRQAAPHWEGGGGASPGGYFAVHARGAPSPTALKPPPPMAAHRSSPGADLPQPPTQHRSAPTPHPRMSPVPFLARIDVAAHAPPPRSQITPWHATTVGASPAERPSPPIRAANLAAARAVPLHDGRPAPAPAPAPPPLRLQTQTWLEGGQVATVSAEFEQHPLLAQGLRRGGALRAGLADAAADGGAPPAALLGGEPGAGEGERTSPLSPFSPVSVGHSPSAGGSALVVVEPFPHGVGIELEAGGPRDLFVSALVAGSSAALCGVITVGDEVVAVEGHEGIDFDAARRLILGQQGTTVRITLRRRQGHSYEVRLTRGSAEYIALRDRNARLLSEVELLRQELAAQGGEGAAGDAARPWAREGAGDLQARVQHLSERNAELERLLARAMAEAVRATREAQRLEAARGALQAELARAVAGKRERAAGERALAAELRRLQAECAAPGTQPGGASAQRAGSSGGKGSARDRPAASAAPSGGAAGRRGVGSDVAEGGRAVGGAGAERGAEAWRGGAPGRAPGRAEAEAAPEGAGQQHVDGARSGAAGAGRGGGAGRDEEPQGVKANGSTSCASAGLESAERRAPDAASSARGSGLGQDSEPFADQDAAGPRREPPCEGGAGAGAAPPARITSVKTPSVFWDLAGGDAPSHSRSGPPVTPDHPGT